MFNYETYLNGSWYNGIIIERFYEKQDCSITFMTRNNLNLHWISGVLAAAG